MLPYANKGIDQHFLNTPYFREGSGNCQKWEFIKEKVDLKLPFFLVEILVTFFFSLSISCFLSLGIFLVSCFLTSFLGRRRFFFLFFLKSFFYKFPPQKRRNLDKEQPITQPSPLPSVLFAAWFNLHVFLTCLAVHQDVTDLFILPLPSKHSLAYLHAYCVRHHTCSISRI